MFPASSLYSWVLSVARCKGTRTFSAFQCPTEFGDKTLGFSQLALPNRKDAPPQTSQFSYRSFVPLAVASNFPAPETAPCLRKFRAGAVRMPVPKTTVHKHKEAILLDHDVGLPRERTDITPELGAEAAKDLRHRIFRSRSTVPDVRHDFTAFGLGVNVGHRIQTVISGGITCLPA